MIQLTANYGIHPYGVGKDVVYISYVNEPPAWLLCQTLGEVLDYILSESYQPAEDSGKWNEIVGLLRTGTLATLREYGASLGIPGLSNKTLNQVRGAILNHIIEYGYGDL